MSMLKNHVDGKFAQDKENKGQSKLCSDVSSNIEWARLKIHAKKNNNMKI